jgi:hypothetical protein
MTAGCKYLQRAKLLLSTCKTVLQLFMGNKNRQFVIGNNVLDKTVFKEL